MNISVFITSYNQKQYLREAIESVLNQTLKPYQVIVVDDCSNDGSQEMIESYRNKYPDMVVPLYHQKNMGVSKTRCDALEMVEGDFATYLDGDDRYLPHKLEKEAEALHKSKDCDIVFSNNCYMSESGDYLWQWICDGESPSTGDVFVNTFSRNFPRKSLFRMELVNYHKWKKIGFHDQRLGLYEDFDMRIRLTKELRATYAECIGSEIRLHKRGLSSSKVSLHYKALLYIYEKNRPLLDDLEESDRQFAVGKYSNLMRELSINSLSELIKKGKLIQAFSLAINSLKFL